MKMEMEMEMETKGSTSSNGGNNNHNARWNPTKEQISILEGLYAQGMRTPTTVQIQRIMSRLRDYGHIEGKNVFYWFQNHKARQRQKEKRQQQHHPLRPQHVFLSFAYMNRRRLHFHSNIAAAAAPALLYQQPPSSTSNGPYYAPYPKVVRAPGSSKRRMKFADDASADKAKFTFDERGRRRITKMALRSNETLDLFPVHPTGIEHDRKTFPSANQDYPAFAENCAGDARRDQPFFDFFSANNWCGQD